MHVAVRSGNKEIVDFLNSHGTHIAACWGELEMIKYICFLETPLHVAVQNNKFKVAQCLISEGAKLELKDINNATALHIATKKENIAMVRCIVEHCANVNCVDKNGFTPLHFACLYGNLELVEYFVEHGALLDCSDLKYGLTPLHLASLSDRMDVVEYLINHGANIGSIAITLNKRQYSICSPYSIAVNYCNDEIASLLSSFGAFTSYSIEDSPYLSDYYTNPIDGDVCSWSS